MSVDTLFSIILIILLVYTLISMLKASRERRSFALSCIIVTFIIWELAELIQGGIPDGLMLLIWRLATGVIIFYPLLFSYFVLDLTKANINKWFFGAYLGVVSIISLTAILTGRVVRAVDQSGRMIEGTLNNVYGVVFLLSLVSAIALSLYLYRRESDKHTKEQLFMLSLGIFILSTWGAMFNYILPKILGIWMIMPSSLGTIAFAVILLKSVYGWKILNIHEKRISVNAKLGLIFIITAGVLIFTDYQIRMHLSEQYALQRQIIYLVFIIIIMAFALSFMISHPISWLKNSIRNMLGGDFDTQVKIGRNDEFGDIARSFNQLRMQLKKAREEMQMNVKRQTLKLTEKVNDLEKFKDLVVESELYAEKMKKERDEALNSLDKK